MLKNILLSTKTIQQIVATFYLQYVKPTRYSKGLLELKHIKDDKQTESQFQLFPDITVMCRVKKII